MAYTRRAYCKWMHLFYFTGTFRMALACCMLPVICGCVQQKTVFEDCDSHRPNDLEEILAEHPKWVDITNEANQTPLAIAAKVGAIDCVRVLLRHGANPNASDWSKKTPVHLACISGNVDILKILVTAGGDIKVKDSAADTPLVVAVCYGKENCVKYLLDSGAKDQINTPDITGNTALHYSVTGMQWNDGTTKLLLNNGANPNLTNGLGETALHEACMFNNAGAVRLLLINGARTDIKDSHGNVPLDIAKSKGGTEIVQLLSPHP